MRAETQANIEKIRKSLTLLGQRLGLDTAQHRLEEFNARVEDPSLWNDPARAQKLMRDRQALVDKLGTYEAIKAGLYRQCRADRTGRGGRRRRSGGRGRSRAGRSGRQGRGRRSWRRCSMGRPMAMTPSSRSTRARAARRPATGRLMLSRMYVRWAEAHGYEVDQQDRSPGTEAGIKSVVFQITGPNAYGWLKSESGVHRLVRISPFGKGTRETSFAFCLGLSGGRRQYRDRGEPRAISASTPTGPRARAGSMSTRRIRPCASPICPRGSS
jgi:peptide chain release factor 2